MRQYDFRRDSDNVGDSSVSISDKPKRKLDIIPRLICLLAAFAIWIYMVNVNDTDLVSTVTVKIEIEGDETLLSERNLVVYGLDKTEVTLTVKGTNRDLINFTDADYKAVIDVSGITDSGKHSATVSVSTPSNSSITLSGSDNLSVSFYTDHSVSKSVPFNVSDSDVFTGVYTYSVESSAESITITGPESMVNSVESAIFQIPDAEYYSSKSFSGFPVLFINKNGEYLTFDESTVHYSTANTTVKLNVMTRMSVPVYVVPESLPSDMVVTVSPSSLYVVGDPVVLAPYLQGTQMLEYVIDIVLSEQDGVIEVGDVFEFPLDSSRLPAGVSFETPDEIVKVTFESLETENNGQ